MFKDILATWKQAGVLDLIVGLLQVDPVAISDYLLRFTLPYGQSLPIRVCDSQSTQAPVLRFKSMGSSETCLGAVEAEGYGCVVHTGDKDLFSKILYSSFLFNRLVFI